MIKIKWIKQKLYGLLLLLMMLVIGFVCEVEGEVGFTIVMIGLYGLWLLCSKEKLLSNDYILYFDVNKFKGL